jgi:hypothetical protein
MPEADNNADLIANLVTLTEDGSSNETLAKCSAVLNLPPVARAFNAGAPAHRAVLVMLKNAAKVEDVQEVEHAKQIEAAAAWTGICPRNTGKGRKYDAGQGARRKAAAEILKRDERTLRGKEDQYCQAYEHAVYDYSYKLSRNPSLLVDFLVECSISTSEAAALASIKQHDSDKPEREQMPIRAHPMRA